MKRLGGPTIIVDSRVLQVVDDEGGVSGQLRSDLGWPGWMGYSGVPKNPNPHRAGEATHSGSTSKVPVSFPVVHVNHLDVEGRGRSGPEGTER